MGNRGYTLMIDALLSLFFLLLIATVVLTIEYSGTARTEVMSFKELHYLSEDALEVLNKRGVLDEVATFWAENSTQGSGEMANASNLSREYLDRILPPNVGYELVILDDVDEYMICNRTLGGDSTVSTHSTRVLVGYGRGLPTLGYVAGASLDAIKSNRMSSYVYFGGFVGQGNITRFLDMPLDADITGAYMELNPGADFNLYINGQQCGGLYSGAGLNLSAKIWDLSACIDNLTGGRNVIDIKFTGSENNFIGGGYLRVDYETDERDTLPDFSTYWFPGVKGLINLYSSFYVPGRSLSSINAYLHYDNNISDNTVYLIIANETVYSSNATGEQFIPISNDNFTGLDYYELESRTVPLRFFADLGNFTRMVNKTVDVILVSDTSGSMEFCAEGQSEGCCQMVPSTCSVGDCSYVDRTWNDSYTWETKQLFVHGYRWNSTCGSGIEKKIDIAKNASKLFVDSILTNPESRLGLVDYSSPLEIETVPRPNMQVTNLTFTDYLSAPGIVGPNKTVEICYGLINLGYGSVAASSIKTRFYLDNGTDRWEVADNNIGDICSGTFTYGTNKFRCGNRLEPGCMWVWDDRILFNATYPPGNYKLVAVVDADDDYLECNESDNEFSVDLTIRDKLPDLIITDLWIDHYGPFGSEYDLVINATVKNQGEVDIKTPFNVSFYRGNVVNKIGSVVIASLNAGETVNAVFTWEPTYAEVCSGSIDVIAWADYPVNDIMELWEDNNNRTIVGGLPSLRPTWLSISPIEDGPNKTIAVFWRVDNEGYGISGPFNISVNLSNATDTWEVAKTRFWPTYSWACDPMRGLRPGNYFRVYYLSGCRCRDSCGGTPACGLCGSLDFKTPMASGDYDVTIVVDPDHEIPECNEGDNTRTTPITVRDAAVDLTVSELYGISSDRINYTSTIKNLGESDAGQFDVKFYNDLVNPANEIGSVTVNGLAGYGGTANASIIWVPSQDELCNDPGAVFVVVDPDNSIIELDETNNQKSIRDPNATIISISFFPFSEEEIYTGSNTYLFFKVKNTGGTDLTVFDIIFYYEDGTEIGSIGVYDPMYSPGWGNSELHPGYTLETYSTGWYVEPWGYDHCFKVSYLSGSRSLCTFGSGYFLNFTAPSTPDNYTIIARICEADEVLDCKTDNEVTATLVVKKRPDVAAIPPVVPFDPFPYVVVFFVFLFFALAATKAAELRMDRTVLASLTFLSVIALAAVVMSGDIPCEPAETIAWFGDSITGFVDLTNDSVVLDGHIDGMWTWNNTCICCGVNRAVYMLNDSNSSTRVLVLMSDGVANVECSEQDTGDANQDAVKAAQTACNSSILVYTVGFGADADEETLKAMACNESMYYTATNAVDLADVYRRISEQILGMTMEAQVMNVTENVPLDSILYPDSYIKLDYSSTATLRHRETPVTLESPAFGNNVTNGSFWVPNGTRVIDAKVTSYSGPYWTDRLYVRNASDSGFKRVYWLDDYAGGQDYRFFGDPYIVSIPVDELGEGYNLVNISVGESPDDPRGGSPSDRVIYTIAVKAYVGYGEPKKTLEGCNWTVQFHDDTNVTMVVPSHYLGGKRCNYTNSTYINREYNNESAIDDAVYRLLTVLDRYSADSTDGRLNIKFDPEDFVIDSTTVGGIRSLWGPIRVKLILTV